ncbi:MAG: hypothetical protein WBG86_07115 [Polyangiales bacterium]
MRRSFGFLVCAAVLFLGCGDDTGSGGTGGTSGGGGSAGTGATAGAGGVGGRGDLPVDACLGELGLLEEIADTVIETTTDCTIGGGGCLLAPDLAVCVGECVQAETGLSTDCALCFGLISDCIVVSCSGPCASGTDNEACEICQANSGCDQVFEDCAGFVPPDSGTGGAGGMGGAGDTGGVGGLGGTPTS